MTFLFWAQRGNNAMSMLHAIWLLGKSAHSSNEWYVYLWLWTHIREKINHYPNNVLEIHLNMLFQPAYEIWIHIASALSFSINMHVQLPSVDKGHDFWRKSSSTPTFCGSEQWRHKQVWIDAQTRLSLSLLKTAVNLAQSHALAHHVTHG